MSGATADERTADERTADERTADERTADVHTADVHATAGIAVVVAAYQAERHLAATLQSVRDQSEPGWVCVVVDDGSTDATGAIAASFAAADGRFSVLTQSNAGEGAARNAGIAALPDSTGLVCFLDSDDLLTADGLETLATVMRRRPDAMGVSGWACLIDVDGEAVAEDATVPDVHAERQRRRPVGNGVRARILRPDEDTPFASLLLYGSISPPATAMVRRSVATQVGGFDETLRCRADGDFWLRVARTGPVAFVDRQIAWYRRHDGNASARTALCARCREIVHRKAWASPDNTPAQRRAVLGANLRLRTWDLERAARRAHAGLTARRPAAVLWAVVWALTVVIRALAVRPVVAPMRWAEAVAALDARCGFE